MVSRGVQKISRQNNRSTVSSSPTAPSRSVRRSAAPVAVHTSAEDVRLSILIPTVPGREAKLAALLSVLDAQTRPSVELLVLRDSRGMTTGEKRTRLIAIARGQYVTFVDDDDMVAGDYVDSILAGLDGDPDVLNYVVRVQGHGPEKLCRYGLKLQHGNLPNGYQRKPNHLMVWRRALAQQIPFPALTIGEDTDWATKMVALASREISLDKVLYTYQFDPKDNSASAR